LDLGKLSQDNNDQTNFMVDGTIDFGFLVNPTMDCFIKGEKQAVVNCDGNGNNATGVIIGSTDATLSSYDYAHTLGLEKNLTFNISTTSEAGAAGVLSSFAASNSMMTLNSVFNVASNKASDGVVFLKGVGNKSQQNINGTFNVVSVGSSGTACGVWFEGAIEQNSTQTINGVFSIYANSDARGVYITNASAHSTQIINGVFSVSSGGSPARGILYSSLFTIGSRQIFNGVYNVYCSSHEAYGIAYMNSINAAEQEINGVFAVESQGSGSTSNAIGIRYSQSENNSKQTIGGTFTLRSENQKGLSMSISGAATDGIGFGENNLFNIAGSAGCFSADKALGTKTPTMHLFGTSATDSNSGTSSDFVTYTQDTNIALTKKTATSNPKFTISYYDNDNVSNQTKTRTKNALLNYIRQPYCPYIGGM
jgi:hypothetical protein